LWNFVSSSTNSHYELSRNEVFCEV
jgi:hypothetical protein